MNKVYTIGRDPSCDIVIADPTDVVSRVHASLKVKGGGKYVLVDQGRNGTYVNGIKMSPNEEIPVSRKDVISFAHIADLDWNKIPKEKSKGLLWGMVVLIAVIAVGIILFFMFKPKQQPLPEEIKQEVPVEALPDSSIKNDTIRDTVFIKPTPAETHRPKKESKKQPVKEDEPKKEAPAEEQVIDALY